MHSYRCPNSIRAAWDLWSTVNAWLLVLSLKKSRSDSYQMLQDDPLQALSPCQSRLKVHTLHMYLEILLLLLQGSKWNCMTSEHNKNIPPWLSCLNMSSNDRFDQNLQVEHKTFALMGLLQPRSKKEHYHRLWYQHQHESTIVFSNLLHYSVSYQTFYIILLLSYSIL